jgi:hypothetical protein
LYREVLVSSFLCLKGIVTYRPTTRSPRPSLFAAVACVGQVADAHLRRPENIAENGVCVRVCVWPRVHSAIDRFRLPTSGPCLGLSTRLLSKQVFEASLAGQRVSDTSGRWLWPGRYVAIDAAAAYSHRRAGKGAAPHVALPPRMPRVPDGPAVPVQPAAETSAPLLSAEHVAGLWWELC